MIRLASSVVCALLVSATGPGVAVGHEARPAYFELREARAAEATYALRFRVPARAGRRLAIDPELPADCRRADIREWFFGGAHERRATVSCERPLVGRTVSIGGLEATRTDALARFERRDGTSQVARLTPRKPAFAVTGSPGTFQFVVLGIEHIFAGLDHLAFVLALSLLVRRWSRLLRAVTAFTVAHSLTLAATVLDWVALPGLAVEAVVAWSIVLAAVEVAVRRRGAPGAAHFPSRIAFVFGLLHGFAFASALREIGLPPGAVPLSLAAFNIGVEIGQVLFLGVVFSVLYVIQDLFRRSGHAGIGVQDVAERVATPAAYVIGCAGAFWLIERTSRMLTG